MSKRSVTHATFVIEREYEASPERVFAAFALQGAKERWFVEADGWETAEYSLDFREGGREIWRGGPTGSVEHRNETVYHEILANERILFTYDMWMGRERISVSLASVELAPSRTGTRLKFTEQGAYLDGSDDGSMREAGTRELLEALARELARA